MVFWAGVLESAEDRKIMYTCKCNWVPMLYSGEKKCVGGNTIKNKLKKITATEKEYSGEQEKTKTKQKSAEDRGCGRSIF